MSSWIFRAAVVLLAVQMLPAFAQTPTTPETPASAASAASAPTTAASAPTSAASAPTPQTITVTGARYRADRVVGSSKTDEARIDTPQAVEVFTRERINDEARLDMVELLQRSPSISNSSSYGITIRGFLMSDRDLFRTDGVAGRIGDRYTQPISLATADRVEVLKGPNAILYGAGADGGVVNVITKRPLAKAEHEAALTLGNFNLKTALVDGTGPLNEDKSLRYRFIAEGLADGAVYVRSDKRDVLVAPSLEWQVGATTLLAQAEWRDSRETPPFWSVTGVAPGGRLDERFRDKSFAADGDFASNRGGSLTLRATHDFDGGAQLNGVLKFNRASNDYRAHYGLELDADGRTLVRGLYEAWDNVTRARTASVYGVLPFDGGAFGQHKLLAGVDVSREKGGSTNCFDCQAAPVPTIDIFEPDYTQQVVVDRSEFGTFAFERDLTRFYLQDTVRFGERWVALLGVARDNFEESEDFTQDGGFKGGKTTSRLGLVFKATPQQSWYLSRSQSFVPQPLYINTDRTIEGTPFAPEQGTQLEAGWQWEAADKRSSVSLAVYRIEKINSLRTSDFPSVDINSVESKGFEAEAVGQLTSRWFAQAGYAFNDAKIVQSADPALVGQQNPDSARHKFTAWTRYDVGALPGFGVGLGARYLRGLAGNAGFQAENYAVFDAALYYKRGKTELSLNVANLTDKLYSDYGFGQTTVYGAPRTVRATVRQRF